MQIRWFRPDCLMPSPGWQPMTQRRLILGVRELYLQRWLHLRLFHLLHNLAILALRVIMNSAQSSAGRYRRRRRRHPVRAQFL